MKNLPPDIGTLHFIGIGGIGMSGIAEVLNTLGYKVQGSDQADNANVARLRAQGIEVFVGHKADNIKADIGAVVVSSAIKADNAELIKARNLKLPVVPRAEMLGELMRLKWTVAVGGTHGKTTTTSLVGCILEAGELDPTVINGGIVNAYGTNTRMGTGDWMVVEADESDGSFTHLPATVAIVTNIDAEHLDHYGSFDAVRAAFLNFVENIPFYGFAVLCTDHAVVQGLIPDMPNKRVVTYGFNPQADIRAVNIRTTALGSMFDVQVKDEATISDIFLPMLGQHNVQNSLAAIAVAQQLKIAPEQIRAGLANFAGVKRRFTKTGISNGVTVIDDYGHHPVEIAAVLKAGRQAVENTSGRLIAVMQPHRYSRLSSLFEEFCTCFNDADTVLIADVYAAGEQPLHGASKESLCEGIKKHGHRDAHCLNGSETLAAQILEIAKPGDYVICLGAGNITQWANALPQQLDEIYAARPKAING